MAHVIWDRSGNPTKHVSDQLGIQRWQLREALHKIKASSNIDASDPVIIYDDGTVTDSNGEPVGKVFGEI